MTQTFKESKDVALVKDQTSKATAAAQGLVIKTQEDVDKAGGILSKMKGVARLIKERKEAITKPLTEALNSARDLFKPLESNLAEAELMVKNKMLAYQKIEDAKAEKKKEAIVEKAKAGIISDAKAVERIEKVAPAKTTTATTTTRTVKKYRVVDESKLPREYLMPDLPKITEALKAGQTVLGAEMYEEKIIAAR